MSKFLPLIFQNGDALFNGADGNAIVAAINALAGGSANIAALTNGILVDPRDYGAKCTGCFGIQSLTISTPGTHFAIGNTFIVADENIDSHARGGAYAIGHVSAVDENGGVVSVVIDYPGSAYYANGVWLTPTSGIGVGCDITITAVYSPPSAPTTTLASGGNAKAAINGSYVPGGAYAAGDLFAVPNPSKNGNYIVCRVDSVSAGVILTYHAINYGGDYAIASAVPTITLTGYGAGATINITSATSANNTFDDTYGFINAATVAVTAGGCVLVPDNGWVATLMLPGGAILTGQNTAPNYAYGEVPDAIHPSTNPHLWCMAAPNFCVDLNNEGGQGFNNFTISAYSNSAYGSTTAIGSFIGNSGSNGKTWLRNMSFKGFFSGHGTPNGFGDYIFSISEGCDYGGSQYGIYGPLSDLVSINDTFVSGNTGIVLTGSAGAFARIEGARFEYLSSNGIVLQSGGSQTIITGCQFDRIVGAGLVTSGANVVGVTGTSFRGCGFAGTLTVTGAANNGSGAIRLHVTGWGNNPNGGSSATSGLVTGDIANVSGIVGTTEANANQWTITVVDGSHIDLQGSTFTNAYVSGGIVGVNGKSSYIEISSSTDIHGTDVDFLGYSAGQLLAPASCIDGVGSSRISFQGGTANPGNSTTGSYQQAFANWQNSGNTPPAHFIMDINNNERFSNEGLTFTIPFNPLNAVNGTYILDAYASFPYIVNGFNAAQTSAGTVTLEAEINSTPITGLGSLALTVTPTNYSSSAANSVAVGNSFSVILSGASSLGNVAGSFVCTRMS